ncbi:hypothetical protein [Saccharopolyspora sp. NPDC049357]|uniref:hypothetical protein n=1 Tax=Saccharopolyspora sp. NPDC049357 TaxID=3154507 RepID=UPI003429D289
MSEFDDVGCGCDRVDGIGYASADDQDVPILACQLRVVCDAESPADGDGQPGSRAECLGCLERGRAADADVDVRGDGESVDAGTFHVDDPLSAP